MGDSIDKLVRETYSVGFSPSVIPHIGFSRDYSLAHHEVVHARKMVLSLLPGLYSSEFEGLSEQERQRRFNELADKVMKEKDFVLGPGAHSASFLNRIIPRSVTPYRFSVKFPFPFLIPAKKRGTELTVERKVSSKKDGLVDYQFTVYAKGILDEERKVLIANVKAFTKPYSAAKVFEEFVQEEFKKLEDKERGFVHKTNSILRISTSNIRDFYESIGLSDGLYEQEFIVPPVSVINTLPRLLLSGLRQIKETPHYAENMGRRTDEVMEAEARRREAVERYVAIEAKSSRPKDPDAYIAARVQELFDASLQTYRSQLLFFNPLNRIGVNEAGTMAAYFIAMIQDTGSFEFVVEGTKLERPAFMGKSMAMNLPLYTTEFLNYLTRSHLHAEDLEPLESNPGIFKRFFRMIGMRK